MLVVALVAALLVGCRRPSPRRELLPFSPTAERVREETRQPGVFYTTYVLQLAPEEHGLVAELWQHVHEGAPEGVSLELRRQNNLRVGLLKEQSGAAAKAVLERMRTRRIQAVPTFSPPGKVYYYDCGRLPQPATVFYWPRGDAVTGRSYPTVALFLAVGAAPAGKGAAAFTIAPALSFEAGSPQPIRSLGTVVHCPLGCSVVVGAVDPQREERRGFSKLGDFFQAKADVAEEREQVLILTADAVVLEQDR